MIFLQIPAALSFISFQFPLTCHLSEAFPGCLIQARDSARHAARTGIVCKLRTFLVHLEPPLPLPAHGGQGETEQEAGLTRLVGGRFHKQGNLYPWLALGRCRTSSSPHPPTRTLNVSIEASMGVQSHIPSRGARQHLTLSRPCPWNGSHCAVGRMHIARTGKGLGKLPVVQVQLEVHPVVMSSQ